MPFHSEAQRKWMHVHHPEMAERWEKHTPKGKDLPEHVGKMTDSQKLVFFSFYFPKSFDEKKIRMWMKARGYPVKSISFDPKGRKAPIAWTGHEANALTLQRVKLADGVIGMRDGFKEIVGKFGTNGSGGGAPPQLQNSELPDFMTIYYQPPSEEKDEREREEQVVRREALSNRTRGKYGIQGPATPKPVVRYHPANYPVITRGQKNEPAGASPKLVVRGASTKLLEED
jgi:hypothetical protein